MIHKYIIAAHAKLFVTEYSFYRSSLLILLIMSCTFAGLILLYPHSQMLEAASSQETSATKNKFSGVHLGNKLRDIGSFWTKKELSLIDS